MKVSIVVMCGLVKSVYSTDPNTEVELVDLDTKDEIDVVKLESRAEELDNDKTIVQVYP